jgi:hypothetical protein
LKTLSEHPPLHIAHSDAIGAGDKQFLLDCLLQDPKRSWLQFLDGHQALHVCVLLHLGRLSLGPRAEKPGA